nr:MAG TPA: hypothetical protein [Caudoviricetes sp.]
MRQKSNFFYKGRSVLVRFLERIGIYSHFDRNAS